MKNYKNFLLEQSNNIDIENKELFYDTIQDLDILESIVTSSEEILNTIKAEEVDLFQSFGFNPDDIESNFSIEKLYDNTSFNSSLNKKDYKKNELESTEETETFIEDTIIIKFFSVYEKDASELEQPEYIIFQSKKKKDSDWEQVKCYKVNDDMKHFYDKLTNKSIEINKGDKTYVYMTSNSGNDWVMGPGQETDTFKQYMNNDEIKAILLDDDVSITIIA